MPRKPSRCDDVLQFENAASVQAAPRRKPRARKSITRQREIAPEIMTTHRSSQDSVHAFLRSGLLLAALRVWELKHGIRDCF
jgi:hypothetical protein